MNNTYSWPYNRNEKQMRILCIRPDNFGDVLMTTPAFRALKQSFPHSHLTLLTSSVGAGIAPLIPEIDDIISFDVPWVAQSASTPNPATVLTMAERLKQGQFDLAILFTVQSQNPLPAAMLCYLAGIGRVLGYCRENPYHLISDWVPDSEVLVATRHEVRRQLDLVAAIGAQTDDEHLSLAIPPDAREQALRRLAHEGVDLCRPWLILHPGVSEEKRRYPASGFAEIGRRLVREQGFQIVLTGSQSERNYAETIRQTIGERAVNLAGYFDLGTLAGLIAEAGLLIANNTGPVHIAAAVGTPVVVLYAKTNPQHTPWLVENRVLYFEVPSSLRSRNQLLQHFPEPTPVTATPDAVVQAVEELSSRLTVIYGH